MSIEVTKGIQLPRFDIEMLGIGKLIAVPFKQFIPEGQTLWLYPSEDIPFGLTFDDYYQPNYLKVARSASKINSDTLNQVRFWGRCEHHWHLHSNNRNFLLKIAQSTIWNLTALEQIFEQHQVLKLLFLRVYRFSEPCLVHTVSQPGAFFWPQPEDKMITATEQDQPVISDASFRQRKAWMMAGDAYPHTSLENLQFQLQPLENNNYKAKQLSHNIKQLLGWNSYTPTALRIPEWIYNVTTLGDRSKEEDAGKSNYQAGTDFEIIVRKSLEFLGFQVDYSHRGGAGGIDIFCSQPYALVGECKSGKKIPNDTAVQLLNLGTLRLEDKETFSKAAKLIIGPGEPTDQLKKAAKVHGMAIINPATLEKLVAVHHQFPIDLFKLRDYFVDGQSDDEIEQFISQHIQAIRLRASIVQLVKEFLENSLDSDVDVSQLHAIYTFRKNAQPLKREEMHEILVELSSPLVGYLGRSKGTDGSDRFYYLRDLTID